MNRNPIISILTVLALVVALLYPLPLHCCHGSSQAGDAIGGSAPVGCHAHKEMRKDKGKSCNRCSSPAEGKGATAGVPAGQGYTIDMADCACTVTPHVLIDAAMLSASGLQVQFHPPVAMAVPSAVLALLLPSVGESRFKVGASPPYMADKAHYTYLFTSEFLI